MFGFGKWAQKSIGKWMRSRDRHAARKLADAARAVCEALERKEYLYSVIAPWPGTPPLELTYSYSNLTGLSLSNTNYGQVQSAVEEALALWAASTNLSFTSTADSGPAPSDTDYPAGSNPQIRLGQHAIDGAGGVLAHSVAPQTADGLAGDVHFDANELWAVDPDDGFDILWVSLHELGHSLGLDHTTQTPAIMTTYYTEMFDGPGTGYLCADDIAGIRSLYGTGRGLVRAGSKVIIGGSEDADTITVTTSGSNLLVTVNGYTYPAFSASSLTLYGWGGVNEITVDGAVSIPVTIYGGRDHDYIIGGAGPNLLYGGDGPDTLIGNDSNDTLYGGNGFDYLVAGLGNDLLDGGDDPDTLLGYGGQDTLRGGAAPDSLDGGDGFDWLYGGSDNDTLVGGGEFDDGNCLYGEDGDDDLKSGGGRDSLYGGPGCDSLDGGSDSDTLYGEDGDDTLVGETGDVLSGGTGYSDTVDYSACGTGITITLTDIEIIIGSGFADTISVPDTITTPVTIYGGTGNDTLTGGGGPDYIYGGNGHDVINGGSGNDSIYGENGNDALNGQVGHDYLVGGAGADTVSGGGNLDTIDFSGLTGGVGVVITLDDLANDSDGLGYTDLNCHDIEKVIGSPYADSIVTWSSSNYVTVLGMAGNDTIQAGIGADYLDGGDGNDSISGGDGNDTIYGQNGNDVLNGQVGHDYLVGGAGADTVSGGGNLDTIDFSGLTGGVGVVITLDDLANDSDGLGYTDLNYHDIEKVIGSPYADSIVTWSSSNYVTVLGMAGNDTIQAGAGTDSLDGGDGDDSISGGDGNDTLIGGNGADTLKGQNGDDWLQSWGDSTADTLDGGAGQDTADVDNVWDTNIVGVETITRH